MFLAKKSTRELSIFIDESGDFGEYDQKSPYYIMSLVVHEQSNDLSEHLKGLDESFQEIGFARNCVHAGPLIRREEEYLHMTVPERVKILRRMVNFAKRLDCAYKTFYVEKKHITDDAEIVVKLAKQLSEFIKTHYLYFQSFDTIKIYYDNGQQEITKIIISVFIALLSNAELKKAFQKDYRLSQVADLVCTAELTRLKLEAHTLSKSERRVLGSDRDIQKYLLKPLKKKEFKK